MIERLNDYLQGLIGDRGKAKPLNMIPAVDLSLFCLTLELTLEDRESKVRNTWETTFSKPTTINLISTNTMYYPPTTKIMEITQHQSHILLTPFS